MHWYKQNVPCWICCLIPSCMSPTWGWFWGCFMWSWKMMHWTGCSIVVHTGKTRNDIEFPYFKPPLQWRRLNHWRFYYVGWYAFCCTHSCYLQVNSKSIIHFAAGVIYPLDIIIMCCGKACVWLAFFDLYGFSISYSSQGGFWVVMIRVIALHVPSGSFYSVGWCLFCCII